MMNQTSCSSDTGKDETNQFLAVDPRNEFEMCAQHFYSHRSGSQDNLAPNSETKQKEQQNRTAKLMCSVKTRLEQGVDINERDVHGRTTLMCFIAQVLPVEVIKLLLDNGADPNITDLQGRSAVHYCVLYNHSNKECLAFQHFTSESVVYDEFIYMSVDNNDNLATGSVVEMLINHGAEINKRDSQGYTLLHLLLMIPEYTEPIRIILENGANVNIINNSKVNVIHSVCQSGHILLLELLLSYGADVRSTDSSMRTVLMNAVDNCLPVDIIKMILDKGADPNSKDELLKTVLHYCCEYDNANDGIVVIQALLESGVDINAGDFHNVTPLMLFVERSGNSDMIEFLLENGADPNKANSYGTTALHIACAQTMVSSSCWFSENLDSRRALKQIVTSLVDHGGDVFGTNSILPIHMLNEDSFEPDGVGSYLLKCMVLIKGRDICKFSREKINSKIDYKIMPYIDSLVYEVEKMDIYMVKETLCLRSFCRIKNKRRLGLYYKDSTLMYVDAEQLESLFPFYHDFIRNKLLKGKIWAGLWNKIDKINMSVRKDGNEVALTSECIRAISYYLNEKELSNIFIAALDNK